MLPGVFHPDGGRLCFSGNGESDETVDLISEYIFKSGNLGNFGTYSLGKGLREIKDEKTEKVDAHCKNLEKVGFEFQ